MTLTVRDLFDIAGEVPGGDVFTQFGEQQSPAHVGHTSNRFAQKHEADLSPLEKKLRERQRLSAAASKMATTRHKEAFANEPRLLDLQRYLRTIQAGDGEELLDALQACEWLLESDKDTRRFALMLIGRRCDKINRGFGIEPLDDPLPPETSVWLRARAILSKGNLL